MVEKQGHKHMFTIKGNVRQVTEKRENMPKISQVDFLLSGRAGWLHGMRTSRLVRMGKMLKGQEWERED